ncbi:MAG TPA: SRPBCC domain-containing protein [Candidatus Binataceae bacterium]|nr:SRPBCC domain-containing protein [Candidatus Binataceae bacterium]
MMAAREPDVRTDRSAMTRTDSATRTIKASPETIFRALMDPDAVVAWLPPAGMRGQIYAFDPRQGGSYRMALVYEAGHSAPGKSSEHTDVVQGQFLQVVPCERVMKAVKFESKDIAFDEAMLVTWLPAVSPQGTKVTVICENVPPGIREEDHDVGLRSTLDNLATFVE